MITVFKQIRLKIFFPTNARQNDVLFNQKRFSIQLINKYYFVGTLRILIYVG